MDHFVHGVYLISYSQQGSAGSTTLQTEAASWILLDFSWIKL